ncbi:MAG TPA: FAD-binding oxidoreductase [Candidatus Methanomethylophilaceae archaeon]|nr:FAD-binding oxidoreductase [Candidatus Methanomethylophilaceae archaeon]
MDRRILEKIEKIVGKDGYSTDSAILYTYGFDASIYHHNPDVVIRPRTTEEVSEIMKIANEERIPVTPRGGGTGLCGSAVPIKGGIVLAMQNMDKIKKVSVADLWVEVEAGVIYEDLNKELAKYGFFFPPSPGSGEACTIGGMVANNASGMRAVKYGATRDAVLGLTFVKADGEIVYTGTRTIKDSSGYQLARLLCGSEGQLGVVTEVILKLTAKPKKSASCICAFNDVMSAGKCITDLIAKPLIPSSCEIMDSLAISAVNKARGNPLPDCNSLIIVEVDGETEGIVDRDLKIIEEVARQNNAISVTASHDKKEIAKWTDARKSVMSSLSALKPGYVSVSLADDMGVPISKVPEAINAFREIAEKHNVIVATYGHASDGNLHTKMMLDPYSKDDWDRGITAVSEIFEKCIELGGTVTGEHGVGIAKAIDFKKERATSLKTYREIKNAMDPNNILNPGKTFDFEGDPLKSLRYPCKECQ